MSNPVSQKIALDDKWLKAAVLGSLWASFEIIVGSMLHNLRIPFAGTFLTLFAVVLLIAFSRIWPERGIILRAGIICALMKSISPSAVILGPMIGILTEAVIIELFLLIFGRNLFAYIIAGGIAVLSALLHKLVNLMILYGFDLIEVYINMINYGSSLLNISRLSPAAILYLLMGIYVIVGAAGGTLGYYLGTRAERKKTIAPGFKLTEKSLITGDPEFKYFLPLLFIHLIFLVLSLLYFEKSDNLIYKSSITGFYILFNVFYYRNLSRRLLKPVFWLQLLIVLILAGIFLETSDPGQFSIENAFDNGLSMFLRAILVIIAFSAISKELANPKIRNLLFNRGFSKLYMALQLAFSALPLMLENNRSLRSFLKNPIQSFTLIIADAENWLESFKMQNHL